MLITRRSWSTNAWRWPRPPRQAPRSKPLPGETSERLGLLGGRYKQLATDAADEAERQRYVDQAIRSYERGMTADLNDYYPASNLPRLYRKRGREGDEKLAGDAEVVTMAACQRALARKTADEWVRPTLLGLAFDRCDVAKAQQLLTEVAPRERPCGRYKPFSATCRDPLTVTPTKRYAGN